MLSSARLNAAGVGSVIVPWPSPAVEVDQRVLRAGRVDRVHPCNARSTKKAEAQGQCRGKMVLYAACAFQVEARQPTTHVRRMLVQLPPRLLCSTRKGTVLSYHSWLGCGVLLTEVPTPVTSWVRCIAWVATRLSVQTWLAARAGRVLSSPT